ncbi:hypothetical protein I302_103366 [Kwoniella bestiolae CBS 10118]|uniref:Uncharacterized protein n=1 Tax=Kwoniella bestiolae CBS 10118 TaxID=1296100 RepID=A0A1B9G865_9TREE|nr:hypothetical protein I302_02067 [Kwoniella bestiolae CBS 10118]OCF27227.1 hypothetical protein I302_02067 [Kwoniella bestiolae CBS 10118]
MPDDTTASSPAGKAQSSANGSSPNATSTTTDRSGFFNRVLSSITKAADPSRALPGDPDSTAISEYFSLATETQHKRE